MADSNQNQTHHVLDYSTGVPMVNYSTPMNRQTDVISPPPLRINVSYQQYAEGNRIPIQHRPQAQPTRHEPCPGCQACAREPHSAECRVYFTDYEPSTKSSPPAATEDTHPRFPGSGVYVRPDPNEPDYYPVSASEYTPPAISTPATPPFRQVQSPTSPLLGSSSPAPAPRSPTSPFASPLAQHWGSPRSVPQSPPTQSPQASPLAQHWGSPRSVPRSPSYTPQSPQSSAFFAGGNHGFYPAPSVEREVPAYGYGSATQISFWSRVQIPEMYRPPRESPDLYTASPPRATLQREESPDLYGASPPRATVQRQDSPDLYTESPPRRVLWPNGILLSALLSDNDSFHLPSPAVQARDSYNAWSQYTTGEQHGSPSLRDTIEQDEIAEDGYFGANEMAVEREAASSQSWDEEIKEEDIKEEDIKEEEIEEEATMQNAPSPSRSVIIASYDSIDIAPRPWPSPIREASSFSTNTSSSHSHSEDDLPPIPRMRLSPISFPLTTAYQRQLDRLEARIRNLKDLNRVLKSDNRVLKNRTNEMSARVRHLEMQCARLEAEQRDELHMQGQIIRLEREVIAQRERAGRMAGAYEGARQMLFDERTCTQEVEEENEGLRERIRELEGDGLYERMRQEIRLSRGIQVALEQTARREIEQREEIVRLREANGWLRTRLEEKEVMDKAEIEEREDYWIDEGVSAGMSRAMGDQMGSLTLEGTRRGE